MLGLWEALYGSTDVHSDDRIAVGTAIGTVVYRLSDDARIQVYSGMLKLPLEQLEMSLHSLQRLTSRDQHLHVMEKLGDEISLVAALLHVFAYRSKQKSVVVVMSESIQTGCFIPDEILSVLRKVWPYIETAASNLGDHEVSRCARKQYSFVSVYF